MNLLISRIWLTQQSTCGDFFIDGVRFCFSLELPVIDGKPGSAIPEGTWPVIVTFSPKFGRDMPLILVTDRSDIRFHWLNYPSETDGCVGLGYTHEPDFIGQSRECFTDFWEKANSFMRAGNCQLTVQSGEQGIT